MEIIPVTASRNYNIIIGCGELANLGSHALSVHKACKACIVMGTNVAPLYGDVAKASLENAGFSVYTFVYPAGEQSKCFKTYEQLLLFLAENRFARSDLLIALGGGVTGDMTGFTAATYLRGIEYIQVPTTLLSSVDSSVGGKTAIDLSIGKNLVGAFYQPSLVLCDPDTLSTLPDNIFADGCAEVIKAAIISEPELFEKLDRENIRDFLIHAISVCVKMKRDIVARDEFDRGDRALLNLGHSFGHAIEAKSEYTVSHGSAVAIGTCIIAKAAVNKGFCDKSVLDRAKALLQKYALPTETNYSADDLLGIVLSDKKISSGSISLIVPNEIGRCSIEKVPAEEIRQWLNAGGIL